MSSSEGRVTARVTPGNGWQPAALPSLSGTPALPRGPRGAVGRPQGAARTAGLDDHIAAAFRDGVVEGRHQAATEAEQRERALGMTARSRWASLTAGLESGLRALESSLADRVLTLATTLAERIACREISRADDAIEAVVADALRLVTDRFRQIEVVANPADCERLERWLDANVGDAACSVRADASVIPGGCLVQVDDTTLDATLETRIRRAFEAVGASTQDGPTPEPAST